MCLQSTRAEGKQAEPDLDRVQRQRHSTTFRYPDSGFSEPEWGLQTHNGVHARGTIVLKEVVSIGNPKRINTLSILPRKRWDRRCVGPASITLCSSLLDISVFLGFHSDKKEL